MTLVGSAVMTPFLWHLTAAVAPLGVALAVAAPLRALGGAHWWLDRPAWLVTYALILMPNRMSAHPVGVAPRPPTADGRARTLPAVTGTVVGVTGCPFVLAWFASSVSAFTGTVLLTATAALTRCGTMPTAVRSWLWRGCA